MKRDALDRDVYNLLGLPFDAVDMDEAVREVIEAVNKKQKLFISTPNLNFLIASQKKSTFRESVLHSDLSIADGMPIVFMCKLLNIPIQERVAGSSLIDELRQNDECRENPIKVFFFGGQDGVAEQAHQVLHDANDGLKSVGYLNPGFGSVDDMSRDEIIDRINSAEPDFIIVSLGAAKGQAWIENNRHRLTAYVISHLGAVVNFIAGTVRRAPNWVQKLHMEWLWRIKEEPALFNRYWKDGMAFVKLLFSRILPYRSIIKRHQIYSTPQIEPDYDGSNVLLAGDLNFSKKDELREILKKLIIKGDNIALDMSGVRYIDQSILGLLLVSWVKIRQIGCEMRFEGLTDEVHEIVKLNGIEFILKGE